MAVPPSSAELLRRKRDRQLFDDILSQQLNIFRLTAQKQVETVKRLDAMAKVLVRQLQEAELEKQTKRDANKVLANSRRIINEYYVDIEDNLEFRETSVLVAENTSAVIGVVMGVESVGIPTTQYFKSLQSNVLIQGSPAADWWSKQAEDTAFKFAAQVRQGLANAETNQQIISRIVGTKTTPGIMETARRNAASLVQTSVQAVANDARRKTFEANKDLIKGIKQVSTLDSHTSITCIAYSGKEWNMQYKPINGNTLQYAGGTPRHFNCRSVEVPITKTFRELGIDIDEPEETTRASTDGPVDAKTEFDDFLKRKGTKWQNEVLGEGRADLWRSGKLTLRDLVTSTGRPLTLDQLRAKL